MKAFLVILVAMLAAALLGWITFSGGDRPSVTVQRDVIHRDLGSARQATVRAAHKAAVEGRELANEVRRTDVDVDVRRDRSEHKPAAAEP